MSDFTKKLENDIEKRQHVLFEIERVLFTQRYSLSDKHYEMFAVQSITMIYSIWEGFIQTAFSLFIDEINNKKIDRETIKDEIYIYHVEKSFKQFNEFPEKSSKKLIFFKELSGFYNTSTIKIPKGVNTNSNVSFEILNNLMKSFCLEPFTEHWKNYSFPNSSLKDSLKTFLRYRNGVAHGGDISSEEKVTQNIYEKYKNLVNDLMFEILIRMTDGIENNCFIKSYGT